MSLRKYQALKIGAALLLSCSLTCSLASPTLAWQRGGGGQGGPGGPGGPGKGSGGQITAVSSSSITLTNKDNKAATFTISSSTKITLDGKTATTSDVKVGLFADVKSKDGKAADAIDVRTTSPAQDKGACGIVTEITTNSITVKKPDNTTATFTITSTTTFTVDGKAATESDVTAGVFAAVHSTDGTAATSVDVRTTPPGSGKGVGGKITAVSSSSITVTNKDNKASTFTISASTKITLDGKTVAASALKTGVFADIKSADGKAADSIAATTKPPR